MIFWTYQLPNTMPISNHPPDWLLVSDIDDTFLGDDEATRQLIDQCAAHGVAIVLNSSRPWASVRETLASQLEGWQPQATITAMGTQVRIDGEEDPGWSQRFGQWSREPFDRFAGEQGWRAHEPVMQTPHKASFAIPPESDRGLVRRQLADLSACDVVISGTSDLDILPPDSGKGPATLYLCDRFRIPTDRLVVAGDSANDVGLFAVASRGVIVGNARAELREALAEKNFHEAVSHYAAGILEGLIAYGAVGLQNS
ncbi:HAD family hydrolase [Mucisphaera sp.]|uniref:HAD family hydrolase n=1 Tax=Mucisphaera sp. TaxID=2913024 RepID=UPI003D0EDE2D